MTTWKAGRQILAHRLKGRGVPFAEFVRMLDEKPPLRVPGTAVFMTAHPGGTPPAMIHNVRHNKVLHRHVVILAVRTRPVPYVASDESIEIEPAGHGVVHVNVFYGFMQDPDVPAALELACKHGLDIDTKDVTYFLGRETILVTRRPGMAMWRERLFVVMAKNAARATGFFRLPLHRVYEVGIQVEM
jgi:KUP system potassium uptake protein